MAQRVPENNAEPSLPSPSPRRDPLLSAQRKTEHFARARRATGADLADRIERATRVTLRGDGGGEGEQMMDTRST